MKKKIDKKSILIILIATIISITSSYVLAATLINSKDVYYEDNSGLAVNNVQAAIDGTCTKFSNQLQEFLLKVYPVGSIYISYNSTNPGTLFGGTWENYGNGRVLKGINSGTAGLTGGSDTVTLSTANLPAHTHDISHTHTTPETDATYSLSTTGGTHSHIIKNVGTVAGETVCDGINCFMWNSKTGWGSTSLSALFGGDGAHTHGITGDITVPKMTTNSISKTISGSTGSGTSFSVQNAYITVYMWRRIK